MEDEMLFDEIKEEFIIEDNFPFEEENPEVIVMLEVNKQNQASLKSWDEFIWKCYYCNHRFNEYLNFKYHLVSFHDATKMEQIYYNCNDCNEPQKGYASFLNHVRSVHHEALKECCDICSETFPNFERLAAHRIEHVETSDIYPTVHHCNQCEKVYLTKKELQKHTERSHDIICKEEANLDDQPTSMDYTLTQSSSKYTKHTQFETLVKYMVNHPRLSKGHFRSLKEKQKSKALWDSLVEQLNAVGPPIRDIYAWKKVWADYKTHTKIKIRRNKRALSDNDDFSKRYQPLNFLETQVEMLLNMNEAEKIMPAESSRVQPTIADESSTATTSSADILMQQSPLPKTIPQIDIVNDFDDDPPTTSKNKYSKGNTMSLLKRQVENQITYQENSIEALNDINENLKGIRNQMEKDLKLKILRYKLEKEKFAFKKRCFAIRNKKTKNK